MAESLFTLLGKDFGVREGPGYLVRALYGMRSGPGSIIGLETQHGRECTCVRPKIGRVVQETLSILLAICWLEVKVVCHDYEGDQGTEEIFSVIRRWEFQPPHTTTTPSISL